jgi:hypothetical protein
MPIPVGELARGGTAAGGRLPAAVGRGAATRPQLQGVR